LLENVKGLLSHDVSKTFYTIIRSLDELGYDCQWQVLNSKDFGVPQNRERVFIVGNFRGEPRPKVFPIRENGELPIKGDERTPAQIAPVLKATNQYMKSDDQYVRVYDLKLSGSKTRRGVIIDRKDSKTLDQQCAQGVALYDISYPSRIRKYTEFSPTVKNFGSGGNKMPMVNAIRRLTPIECERLQGFPDGWTEGISDTQRYKCLGNAVTVNVVEYIVKNLF
jgi:DNA (cytosine-5)-methyltransferase 1